MEKKNYSVLTTKRAATPRSERGRTQTQRAASIITVVGGDAEDGSAGSGHMHDNKEVIDSLRADSQSDYLYIRKIPAGQDPVNCKVSAGKADDATQWNGHSFDEYLDQKMRRIDAVEFASVKVGDSVFSKFTQTARAAVGMAAQYALSLFDKIGANSILLRLFRLHADHVTVEESLTSSDFGQDGFTGKGFGLTKDSSGRWVLETDKLVVRRSLNVNEVVINQISHIGGRTIYSSANMECARVEEMEGVYRCYLDTENGRRRNLFIAGDQAYCQRFDPASNNVIRYYWRLVTGVGVDYIDLSKSVADTGSDTPASGDMIVQIGHRANTGADPDAYTHRQAMLEINQSGGGHVIQYAGIDSFDFDDKGQVGFGYDASRKRAKMFVHGDIFFGDKVIDPELNPDATFITYQQAEGDTRPRVHIQADMNFTDRSTGLSNLSDFQTLDQKANVAQDTASKAQITANQALSEAVNIVADYNARFALQQAQIDGEVSNWYYPYTPTPKNAPANSWSGADFDERERHIGDTFLNTQPFAFNPDNVNEWERGGSYGSTLYPWEGDNKDGSSYRIRTPQMLRISGIVKMSVSIGKVIAYYATTPNGNLTGNSDWQDAVSVNEKDHPYVAFAVKMDDGSSIYPTDIVNMIGLYVEGHMSHVDTGKAWRWIKNDNVYSWTPIADSDAVKALQDSAKAQSTADGKSTTFVLTGTKTPNIYRYGDMWVLQSDTIHAPHKSGEVLFSTTNRTNQYVSGDWVTKVRYTDDSGANEAKAVAVKAQDTADAAKARTDAAATDGLIAIEEKLQLKRDRDSIVKETKELVVIAAASGIAQSFITNLNSAKEDIVGYMNATMGLNSMTSDTLLLPNYTDVFATLMATYTKRVQELSNAISQKQVDNVQIANVNLALNTSAEWMAASHAKPNYRIDYSNLRNKVITVRVTLKGVGVVVDHMGYETHIMYADNTSSWFAEYDKPERGDFEKMYTSTHKVLDKEVVAAEIYCILKNKSTTTSPIEGTLAAKEVFVGLGNKLPTWSPAQQDGLSTGRIYLRGTGYNHNAARIVSIGGKKILEDTGGRGLQLVVLRRSDLSVVSSVLYDIYESETQRNQLATDLAALDSTVLVCLTSYDCLGGNAALDAQLQRCGGSVKLSSFGSNRIPYALLGIPGVGKDGGIEVYTDAGATAPYAEISTTVIEGTPSGINEAAGKLANAAIDAMNNDGIFDIVEKQTIRTQWEAISGYDRTDLNLDTAAVTNGSYYKMRDLGTGLGLNVDKLKNAVDPLRRKLDAYALYTNVNTAGFDRKALAELFRNYYAQETNLLDAVNQKYIDNVRVGQNVMNGYNAVRVDYGGSYIKDGIYTNVLSLTSAGDRLLTNTITDSRVHTQQCIVTILAKGTNLRLLCKNGYLDLTSKINSTEYTEISAVLSGTHYVSGDFNGLYIAPMNGWVRIAKMSIALGNKSIGITPSDADVQAKVDAAKDAAAAANAAIDAMNNDGIFDIVEKQTIRTQWEAISGYDRTDLNLDTAAVTNGSYYKMRDLGTGLGLNVDNLKNAVDSLRRKLDAYALYTNVNTAGFDRKALAELFRNYYAQETNLLDAVNQKYIDNVQVGGVNLINGSRPAIPWTGNSGKYALKTWTSPSNSYIKKGKTYTVVAELYVDASFVGGGGRGIQFFVGGMQSIDPVFKYTTPTVISTTFTANRDGYLDAYHMPSGTGGNSYINWVKLVEGNKASLDWLESPADTQAKIDKVQSNVDDYKYLKTILSGHVVSGSAATLTGLLGVTSMDSSQETKIVGGLTSGLYTKDDTVTKLPMLFSGADGLTQAFRAKLILTSEGMFRVRRGSNAVTIHEGEMSLQTLVGESDLETTKVLISPRVYTTFDGGVNTVNHFQNVSVATDIYDVSIHWLTHYSGDGNSATEISNEFSVGVNASVTIPDIVCELRFPLGTTGKLEFNLRNLSTGLFQSNPLKANIVGSAQTVVITVSGKTFTQVPQGAYKLVIRTLEVKHPTTSVRGSVVIKQTSSPMRISNVVSQVPVQLFGQGILCTQDATHYAGMMKQGVMEVCNGDHGLRVDDAGIARRGKSRQWDYSGMLCAGKITAASGYIFPQFGIVECQSSKMPDGNLKITHRLGHTNYIVTAIPYGDPAWNKLHVVVVNKGANAFELRTVDSGTANTNAPRDIDFMIYGVW